MAGDQAVQTNMPVSQPLHLTKLYIQETFRASIEEKVQCGTSLMVQWLRLCPPNAGDRGLIPGQGTTSRMLQLRVCTMK